MNLFKYSRAGDAHSAIAAVSADPGAMFLAGGTTVIDLTKETALQPSLLVDITALPMAKIERTATGVLIGALAKMSDVADDPTIATNFPVVSQALLLSASPQLRNMASIGGNLMQRTRCSYFRDAAVPCNKRTPGSGCSAVGGVNRRHAVLGGSPQCICVHASDLAVALTAVDARVHVTGPGGTREIPIAELYLLPGSTPQRETVLAHGDLITAVEIPVTAHAKRSVYLKVRDRASYEFALVSVAAALDISGGTIRSARVVLGGVAPVPWRSNAAEAALRGQPAIPRSYLTAAAAVMNGARGYGQNDFKIELGKRAVIRALSTAGGLA